MRNEYKVELAVVALNAQETAPKSHKITPVGRCLGVDGRVYEIDGEELIRNTKELGIDIVIDENHMGGKALGWIALSSLELKEDGIYGQLEWTESGKSMIAAKEYRYLSPAYRVDEQNPIKALSIFAVGLVNSPNLLKEAVNKSKEEVTMAEVAKNENEEIDFETLKAEFEALKAEYEKALGRIAELEKQLAEEGNKQLVAKVDAAIKAGELAAKNRDFALSLGAGRLDEFLALQKQDNAELKKPAVLDKDARAADGGAYAEVKRQLGI